MVADHYTNPDDSDVRVEAEQDAGDLYCGEGKRRHNRNVEEDAEIDGAEAAQEGGRHAGIAQFVEINVGQRARPASASVGVLFGVASCRCKQGIMRRTISLICSITVTLPGAGLVYVELAGPHPHPIPGKLILVAVCEGPGLLLKEARLG